MIDLRDRVIIVTGGGRGIGQGCCELLAEMGAKVVIAEIDEQTGAQTCKDIEAAGGQVMFVATDIGDTDSVHHMRDQTLEHFGNIDALVNNATLDGFNHSTMLDEMSLDMWDRMINVSLTGVFRCIQAVMPTMRANSYGRIVNFSSVQAVRGVVSFGAYQAAKAGVAALTRAAAMELAQDNILVNGVQPGWIAVSMTAPYEQDPDWQREWIETGRICIGRMGKAREVAQLVAYLASDWCQYITGQIIPIDGGLTAKL